METSSDCNGVLMIYGFVWHEVLHYWIVMGGNCCCCGCVFWLLCLFALVFRCL